MMARKFLDFLQNLEFKTWVNQSKPKIKVKCGGGYSNERKERKKTKVSVNNGQVNGPILANKSGNEATSLVCMFMLAIICGQKKCSFATLTFLGGREE